MLKFFSRFSLVKQGVQKPLEKWTLKPPCLLHFKTRFLPVQKHYFLDTLELTAARALWFRAPSVQQ
jgi:hypothetical protein